MVFTWLRSIAESFPTAPFFVVLIGLHLAWAGASLVVWRMAKRKVTSERHSRDADQQVALNPAIESREAAKHWLQRHEQVGVSLAMSVLGLALGILAGNSRTPVVDGLLTSAMTVFGAVSMYLFAKGTRRTRLLSIAAIAAFALTTVWGAHIGASMRFAVEMELRQFTQAQDKRRLELDLEKERTLILYKLNAKQLEGGQTNSGAGD